MHRFPSRWFVSLVLVVTVLGGSSAFSFPPVLAAFKKKYVASNPDNKEWAALVTKAGCFICHQGKKSKKNRNPYGAHLAEFIDGPKDGKNAEKLKKAFESVAAMHSIEGDEKSPTYGELIKEGKLPGGPLEDAQKEPAAGAK